MSIFIIYSQTFSGERGVEGGERWGGGGGGGVQRTP